MLLPPFSGVGLPRSTGPAPTSPSASSCPTSSCGSTPTTAANRTGRVEGLGLAADVPVTGLPERVRGRDRIRPTTPDLGTARKSPNGTVIAPAPPRTGMPSAMIAKAVARSVVDMIGGASAPTHTASMAEMGAACVASAGANPFTGTAASMTVYPIVPDYDRYPEYGRDPKRTFGEIGLAGHWIKILLHHMFLLQSTTSPRLEVHPRVEPGATR